MDDVEINVLNHRTKTLNGGNIERDSLRAARRMVVKIGSAPIADAETGEIRSPWLETLIEDVVRIFARGQQVIIVTSGAVAVRSCHFNQLDRPLRIEEKQTAAAIGQVRLMLAYKGSKWMVEFLHVWKEGPVGIVVLNRPKNLNAWHEAMRKELGRRLIMAQPDTD